MSTENTPNGRANEMAIFKKQTREKFAQGADPIFTKKSSEDVEGDEQPDEDDENEEQNEETATDSEHLNDSSLGDINLDFDDSTADAKVEEDQGVAEKESVVTLPSSTREVEKNEGDVKEGRVESKQDVLSLPTVQSSPVRGEDLEDEKDVASDRIGRLNRHGTVSRALSDDRRESSKNVNMEAIDIDPQEAILKCFQSDPANMKCADCGTDLIADKAWASVNNLVFICTKCAGVHRSLGVDKSFVQSLTLDKWKDIKVVQKFYTFNGGGNTNSNKRLEYQLSRDANFGKALTRPQPDSTLEDRKPFIDAKYSGYFEESSNHMMQSLEHQLRKISDAAPSVREKRETSEGSYATEFTGYVKVTVVKGNRLAPKDITGLSDPFVEVNLGTQKLKTKVIPQTLNPQWNEDIMLSGTTEMNLGIEVYDQDQMVGHKDYMGGCLLNLNTIDGEKKFPITLRIPLNEEHVYLQEAEHYTKHVIARGKKRYFGATGSQSKYSSDSVAGVSCSCFGAIFGSSISGTLEIDLEWVDIS
eukprot:g2529.t1